MASISGLPSYRETGRALASAQLSSWAVRVLGHYSNRGPSRLGVCPHCHRLLLSPVGVVSHSSGHHGTLTQVRHGRSSGALQLPNRKGKKTKTIAASQTASITTFMPGEVGSVSFGGGELYTWFPTGLIFVGEMLLVLQVKIDDSPHDQPEDQQCKSAQCAQHTEDNAECSPEIRTTHEGKGGGSKNKDSSNARLISHSAISFLPLSSKMHRCASVSHTAVMSSQRFSRPSP